MLPLENLLTVREQLFVVLSSSSSPCTSSFLEVVAAAATELFEARHHGTHVPHNSTELNQQQNDTKCSAFGQKAEAHDQDEGRDDNNGGPAALLVEHLVDLAFEARQEKGPKEHSDDKQTNE